MDLADKAGAQSEVLDALRLQNRPRQDRRDDAGIACQSCGDEIPAARRAAVTGCRYCIDCQEDFDRRAKWRTD